MDKIYECAAKFVALENYKYRFVVSQNRKDTLKYIIEKKKITDELLHKSRFYINSRHDKDIKSRIEELRFLEEYLDTNNIIRIYNTQNDKYLHSFINADYLIESQFKGSQDIVYIFLKKRIENPDYLCIESFF